MRRPLSPRFGRCSRDQVIEQEPRRRLGRIRSEAPCAALLADRVPRPHGAGLDTLHRADAAAQLAVRAIRPTPSRRRQGPVSRAVRVFTYSALSAMICRSHAFCESHEWYIIIGRCVSAVSGYLTQSVSPDSSDGYQNGSGSKYVASRSRSFAIRRLPAGVQTLPREAELLQRLRIQLHHDRLGGADESDVLRELEIVAIRIAMPLQRIRQVIREERLVFRCTPPTGSGSARRPAARRRARRATRRGSRCPARVSNRTMKSR